MSVLVVDDSVVVRKLVTRILDADPDLRVVGTAANGRIALEKIPLLAPDIVTLDIEMPDMDGLETLAELRKIAPRLPVIMFSTLTERAAASTLDALALGASDYVTKPTQLKDPAEALEAVRQQLVPKIKALTGRSRRPTLPTAAPTARPAGASPVRRRTGPPARPRVLAIGSSTGGPDALATLVAKLPAALPVPVVVVQHMPPVFTRLFAQRLDRLTGLTVREAIDKEPLRPGEMLIAPGDRHLSLRRDGDRVVTVLSDGLPENHCRPAVDVLFRGVVEAYGANVLSVILTGMGQDGLRGGERVVEAGGALWAQDQATSVVWGMPGAVVNAGLASRVLPGPEIGAAIAAALAGSTDPAAGRAGALR